MNISHFIDYTLVAPSTTEHEIIDHCYNAIKNGNYAVTVNSCYVPLAAQLLADSDVKTCATVGFPFGFADTKSKVFEATEAINNGATEIDMVINLGYLKSRNYVSVLKDIFELKRHIGNTPLKVTIEISELTKNEIIKACEICLDARVDFIKTSTGFSKGGATLTAVKIIKKTVKNKIKIIASNGIDDYETILKYIESGADIVGTSTNVMQVNKTQQARNSKIFKQYIDNLENKQNNENHTKILKEMD
ncbi:deoxyribose-phosphate aldolase [Tamlana sp. 62-3]|uniref:Deoxyribose-phosphate aldolase n=1 Tax=Neotamlana sargassicola TaxID=2883125 RepID=A0A9X1L4J3_9FLAO|nr:deoxyribose-phosphate aldolase [Tamlana sargassicola]MCB4808267.1 deoxyribose-phosphate aldolase [Tamlana sargassicola]